MSFCSIAMQRGRVPTVRELGRLSGTCLGMGYERRYTGFPSVDSPTIGEVIQGRPQSRVGSNDQT